MGLRLRLGEGFALDGDTCPQRCSKLRPSFYFTRQLLTIAQRSVPCCLLP